MTNEDLGYNDHFEAYRKAQHLEDFEMGRIIAEHRERYLVKNEDGEFEAELTGNLRFSATNREDYPVVGDWVLFIGNPFGAALIQHVFPRFSTLSRQAVGQHGERQIIATNMDFALLVQAIDRDFNLNRLERYLTICYASKVRPVIVLTKIDLISPEELEEVMESLKLRIPAVPVFAISNETLEGYGPLKGFIKRGKSYGLLGSSGVGKSTLLNHLSGKQVMKTEAISQSTHKGRHTTSHRQLTVLKTGGILMDNPGMRELGVVDSSDGLETAFKTISSLSKECRFTDCSHIHEKGCAVAEALEQGIIDRKSYENYLSLEREKAHFELTSSEKKKKDKDFGKMVRHMKNDMRKLGDKRG